MAKAASARLRAAEEEELVADPSRPLTRFIDCVMAVMALDTIDEELAFRSFCTVAKSELALVRLPELKSPLKVVKSVESCELADEVLPLMLLRLLFSCCRVCSADWASLTLPDARLLCRFWAAVCMGLRLLAS